MTPAGFGAAMLGAVNAALPYITVAVAAAMLVFGVTLGIRTGVRVFREVAADRDARAWDRAMYAYNHDGDDQYAAGEARQAAGLDVDPEDFAA